MTYLNSWNVNTKEMKQLSDYPKCINSMTNMRKSFPITCLCLNVNTCSRILRENRELLMRSNRKLLRLKRSQWLEVSLRRFLWTKCLIVNFTLVSTTYRFVLPEQMCGLMVLTWWADFMNTNRTQNSSQVNSKSHYLLMIKRLRICHLMT